MELESKDLFRAVEYEPESLMTLDLQYYFRRARIKTGEIFKELLK